MNHYRSASEFIMKSIGLLLTLTFFQNAHALNVQTGVKLVYKNITVADDKYCEIPEDCFSRALEILSSETNAASLPWTSWSFKLIGDPFLFGSDTVNGRPKYVQNKIAAFGTPLIPPGPTTGGETTPLVVELIPLCFKGSSQIYGAGHIGANEQYRCQIERATQDPPPWSCPSIPNPVFGETGLKRQVEVDYKSPSSNLVFQRTWRSDQFKFFTEDDAFILPGTSSPGYSAALSGCYQGFYYEKNGDLVPYCFPVISSGIAETQLFGQDGNSYLYSDNGTSLTPPADINQSITKTTDSGGAITYTVRTQSNALEQYDINGRITSRRWANGQALNYGYAGGRLTTMTDEHGQSLAITYNTNGTRKTLVDPAGGITQYAYDEPSGNCPTSISGGQCQRLTSVIYPDGKVRRYHYNEATHVDPNLQMTDAYLTGITDETGQRLSNYKYNAQGQVISSGWGNLDYNLAYSPYGDSTVVTDLLGTNRVTSYSQILGRLRPTGQSQPGGSGCTAASSAITYDANANKASEDDFTGKRVCYAHDLNRNLQATRVEGLTTSANCASVTATGAALTVGSRKISTQWHPDWRLESRIAEPGRVTTLVYNGQPDPTAGSAIASCAPASALLPDGKPIAVLCKKVEQATTDANGSAGFAAVAQAGVAARIWKWTYDDRGQVLTEDGPRTDVSDVTTYTYHAATAFTGTDPYAVGVTLGDLKTVTNAAGTTQYTKYNKHGQLLESIDPNGVVSSYSYDLRQRLLSSTVGGQQTTYAYDPAGQLKKVTRPDTSWTGYDYDAAHRLVAVYNNLGNRIDYTLDNAGNRTAENIKDPGGALKRQLARSIDPLGRVQQTTGRE